MNKCIRPLSFVSSWCLLFTALWAFAADLETTSPEQVGLSSTRLERIASVLQPYLDKQQIAGGVVGVARDNKLVYLRSFGSMDLERNTPMANDAIFRIASMTKPITSVAVMMLYEDGKFLLTDPVSKYIPEFKEPKVVVPANPGDPTNTEHTIVPANREITILDLLTHTSGISYRFKNKAPVVQMYEAAGIHDGLIPIHGAVGDMVKKLAKLPLVSQPGQAYEYGLNTDVLGYLVEVTSGMPLDRFFKERIFAPLKMTDTQFYIAPSQRARLAAIYGPGEQGGISKAAEGITRRGQLEYSPDTVYSEIRTYFSGGGGLTSTVPDYLRFTQMLLNGGRLDDAQILSPKSVELMASNHIGKLSLWDYPPPAGAGNQGDKFGLGFGVRSEAGLIELGSVGEYMWAGIYNTRFWIDPKEKITIVFMSQILPRMPEIEAKIHAAVYQAITK